MEPKIYQWVQQNSGRTLEGFFAFGWKRLKAAVSFHEREATLASNWFAKGLGWELVGWNAKAAADPQLGRGIVAKKL